MLKKKDCFSSTVSAFQSLSRDRFWQQVLFSEVRTPGLCEHRQAFLEPLGSHPTKTKTMQMRLLYNPTWLGRKQQHLSTSQSNHVIALSSSPYRFPWFGQHFPPYDLSCTDFCMSLLGLCSYILYIYVCVYIYITYIINTYVFYEYL